MGTSSFYPHNGPSKYSYTADFANSSYKYHGSGKQRFYKTALQATMNLKFEAQNLYDMSNNVEVLNNIQALIDAERSSELNFLSRYGLPNPGNDWGKLIKTFSLLFEDEQVFNLNLEKIRQVQDKQHDRKIFQQYEKFFTTYLQGAMHEYIMKHKIYDEPSSKFIPELLNTIIKMALQRSFEQTEYISNNELIVKATNKQKESEDVEKIQAYSYLNDKINYFMNDEFTSGVIKAFNLEGAFYNAIRLYNKAIKAGNKKNFVQSHIKIKDSVTEGRVSGSFREYFTAVLGQMMNEKLNFSNNSFQFTSQSGGDLGFKTDVMVHNLAMGNATIYETLQEKRKEVRGESNIDDNDSLQALNKNTMSALFETLKKAQGDIIFISDKAYQYQLNDKGQSTFKGFQAQEVKLKNLQAVLSTIYSGEKKSFFDTEQLINFLSNCGKDMILGESHSRVMDAVASQIAHFLFDDVHIETSIAPNINRVHLLDLSSFMVPLSVYLESMKQALIVNHDELIKSVNIVSSFKPEDAARGWKTEQEWIDFRNSRLEAVTFDIHFMKDFANFLLSNITINT